jgi:hypothetical protein
MHTLAHILVYVHHHCTVHSDVRYECNIVDVWSTHPMLKEIQAKINLRFLVKTKDS